MLPRTMGAPEGAVPPDVADVLPLVAEVLPLVAEVLLPDAAVVLTAFEELDEPHATASKDTAATAAATLT